MHSNYNINISKNQYEVNKDGIIESDVCFEMQINVNDTFNGEYTVTVAKELVIGIADQNFYTLITLITDNGGTGSSKNNNQDQI